MGNLAFAMQRCACGIKPEPYVIVSLFCVILCMGRGSLKFGGYKASLKFGGYKASLKFGGYKASLKFGGYKASLKFGGYEVIK